MRRIQLDWETRWRKDFPDARLHPSDSPEPPEQEAAGRWNPAFKIPIQPLCEKDIGAASYAYLFIDMPKTEETPEKRKTKTGKAPERLSSGSSRQQEESSFPPMTSGGEN